MMYFLKQFRFILYPFFVVFGVGYFLLFTDIKLLPDFANIKNYSKIYELFSLVISSLVSIIGIYISVSLVAYEFFKQKSGIDFHKSLLVNEANAYYISFSVMTILFAFLCSIIVPSTNPDWNQVNIVYYSSILFCIVISLLLPVAFNLFSSLKPEKLANDELHKITNYSVFIQSGNKADIDKSAKYLGEDSLLKVENIVIALIAVSDHINVQAIILKTSIKLTNLIIDEKDFGKKEYIINRLISFYIRIIDFSLLQPNNSLVISGIWRSVKMIYSTILERNETTTHLKEFREKFFERYFSRLFQNNKEEAISEGVTTIVNIIEEQFVFNNFEDKKIYQLNQLRSSIDKDFNHSEYTKEYNYEYTNNWQEITIGLIDCIRFVINKAIKLNHPDLLNKCFSGINDLNFQLKLANIEICSQSFFYINSANIICDYTHLAFKKNVFVDSHDPIGLLPSLFEDLIEGQHPAARKILQNYCYLLINLQNIDKLDRWFIGGLSIGDEIVLEGELGGIARNCVLKYNDNKVAQNCLTDCISTFKILKENFEEKLPQNLDLYLTIKKRFESILKYLTASKIDNSLLIADLKREVGSFKLEK